MKKSILCCCLLACRLAHASVSEHLDYTYYTASMTPSQSVASVLHAVSPIRENGTTFLGHTHWEIRWHYSWHYNNDGRCRMTGANINLNATIQLPQITNATAQQQASFDRFIAALRVHELGHYEHGRQAAQEIDQAIMALPEMGNCQALGAAADEAGHRILRHYSDLDVQYDATTSHGRTQGAVISN